MKKDHKKNTVGPWAEEKLKALQDYLQAYNHALKNKPFRRVYIDAFAGSPISRIRTKDDSELIEPSAFFEDEQTATEQEKFVAGSPIRALECSPGFHQHFFFDLDQTRAEALQTFVNENGRTDVKVQVGDCNPLLRDLAGTFTAWDLRGVAFLDPYGAHLEWSTLVALAKTQKIEVIINFPVAMAINRLIVKSGNVPEKWSDQLDACFGTSQWRDLSYRKEVDLFGAEYTTKEGGVADRLLGLYMTRLHEIFPHVAPPRLIRNTRKAPLYYLIWAGPNEVGLKIARHVLKQGEKVRKRP